MVERSLGWMKMCRSVRRWSDGRFRRRFRAGVDRVDVGSDRSVVADVGGAERAKAGR